MNSILSIFVCLAMLMSGAYGTEDPAQPASRVTTISDVVVTINDEEYALNPGVALGVATQENTALFDFSMPTGDDVLFPVQAKVSEEGVSVLLGDSSTAYTFSPEFFDAVIDASDMPEGTMEFIDAYCRLLSGLPEMMDSMGMNATYFKEFAAAAGDSMTEEETTTTVNGEEVPATRYVFSLDTDAVCKAVDAAYESIGLGETYYGMMNALMQMSGESNGEAIQSYADLMAMTGVEMTIEGDVTVTEDGFGSGTVTTTMTQMGQTFVIPISVELQGENAMTLTSSYEMLGGNVEIYEAVNGGAVDLTMAFSMGEINMNIALNFAPAEDGSSTASFNMAFDVPAGAANVEFAYNAATDAAGDMASDLSMKMASMGMSFGASAHIEDKAAEIVDRIASAQQEVINTEQEASEATGLMMSVMGLASDAEKLTTDESVLALVEAAQAVGMDSTSIGVIASPDDDPILDGGADIGLDANMGNGDPSELSFPMPTFTWMPEGYELTNSYIYPEYGSVNLYFDYTAESDAYKPTIYIDLYALEGNSQNYVLGEDGALTASEGTVVSIETYDDSIYATCNIDGASLQLSYYGDDLTAEDIAAILNGITY